MKLVSAAIILLSLIVFTTCVVINTGSAQTVINIYGQLNVSGTQIVDKNGNPIALRGMSLFWSQWVEGSIYYNPSCVEWLRNDWKCTVVRAAMGVEEENGYLTGEAAKELERAKVIAVIDACIKLGIYVIVDWHDHHAHNHQDQAIEFFTDIASEYGDYPNIIYEIYNEPIDATWNDDIKPYAEAVIAAIRAYDPDNLIIVGTPFYSQHVDVASENPIAANNIAYVLHFYAADDAHGDPLRARATEALNNGIALFISEWGTCESNGSGEFASDSQLNAWYNFMNENQLSWCNWSISNKDETASALEASAQWNGNWGEDDLTQSGKEVRGQLILLNSSVFADL